MANRMISYGYGMVDGYLSVIEKEAAIVRRIFAEYCKGEILAMIARRLQNEGVEYYMGNCQWNKNRINRIIENEKYIGADEYPPIITDDEFCYAKQLKNKKGGKLNTRSRVVEVAKAIVYCGQCGHVMTRRAKWRTREKWLCACGCKQKVYVDDEVVFNAVREASYRVLNSPELLENVQYKDGYCQTQEILRLSNEINRVLNERTPQFLMGKKLILQCAELKFQECKEDISQSYTQVVKNEVQKAVECENFDEDFLKKVVSKVIIQKSGEVIVQFINGSEITVNKGVKVDASTEEDNHEDSGEPVAV